jgi:hypothetical protein
MARTLCHALGFMQHAADVLSLAVQPLLGGDSIVGKVCEMLLNHKISRDLRARRLFENKSNITSCSFIAHAMTVADTNNDGNDDSGEPNLQGGETACHTPDDALTNHCMNQFDDVSDKGGNDGPILVTDPATADNTPQKPPQQPHHQ